MKVTFADSFWESLKKMSQKQTWWYRTYDFIRRGIPRFFRNVFKFRKELYNHNWWDYSFTLQMMYRSISIIEKGIREKGYETEETKQKKLESMQRVLELLKNKIESNYVDRAEVMVGSLSDWDFWEDPTEEQRKQDRLVFDTSNQLEEMEWKEIWRIISGTEDSKQYGKNYDGSDMRSWWD